MGRWQMGVHSHHLSFTEHIAAGHAALNSMLLIGLNWLPVAAQIKFVHSIIQVYAPFGAPRSSQERHLALPSLVSFIA